MHSVHHFDGPAWFSGSGLSFPEMMGRSEIVDRKDEERRSGCGWCCSDSFGGDFGLRPDPANWRVERECYINVGIRVCADRWLQLRCLFADSHFLRVLSIVVIVTGFER